MGRLCVIYSNFRYCSRDATWAAGRQNQNSDDESGIIFQYVTKNDHFLPPPFGSHCHKDDIQSHDVGCDHEVRNYKTIRDPI